MPDPLTKLAKAARRVERAGGAGRSRPRRAPKDSLVRLLMAGLTINEKERAERAWLLRQCAANVKRLRTLQLENLRLRQEVHAARARAVTRAIE